MKSKFGWLEAVLVLLFLFFVYLVLDYTFGNSPTILEVMLILFTFIGGLVFKAGYDFAKINREMGENKIITINSFKIFKKEVGEIKEEIRKIDTVEEKVLEIEKDIKIIKETVLKK